MICRDCKIDKAETDFYFVTTKSRDGSKSWTYSKPECKLCCNKRGAAYYASHKEQMCAAQREYYFENVKKFDYWRSKSRAKSKGATLFMSVEEWEFIKNSKNCYWCKIELKPAFANVDHLTPLCEGGQHTAENVVMSCANCNMEREWNRKIVDFEPKPKEDSISLLKRLGLLKEDE